MKDNGSLGALGFRLPRNAARVCAVATGRAALALASALGASASAMPAQLTSAPLAAPSRASVSSGTRLWIERYNEFGSGDSVADSVADSPSGRTVYVTGYGGDTADGVSPEYATVAYSASTGKRLWAAVYRGGATAISVVASPSGKAVFVTGQGTSGQFTTIAYNAVTGARLWVKAYGSNGSPYSMTVSPTGNAVFVTGETESGAASLDYDTVAYSAVTGKQLWVKTVSAANDRYQADQIVSGPAGKTVYVTLPGLSGSHVTYVTIAYNAATGARLWTKSYLYSAIYTSSHGPSAIAVSPTGKAVFVTGNYVQGQLSTDTGYATVAYNATTGAQLWAKRYSTNGDTPLSNTAMPESAAVSPSGKTVFITGETVAADSAHEDYATVAYNAATGAQLWARIQDAYPEEFFEETDAIAVSRATGTVFVTGSRAGP